MHGVLLQNFAGVGGQCVAYPRGCHMTRGPKYHGVTMVEGLHGGHMLIW